MEKVLDIYLESINLNRCQVSKATGISYAILKYSSERKVFNINPRILWGISLLTDRTPGQILDDLISLEMKTSLSIEDIMLLMKDTFRKFNISALTSVLDMGNNSKAVEIKLILPSTNSIRFKVYNYSCEESATRRNLLQDLSFIMQDYTLEKDGNFFPSHPEFTMDKTAVMAVPLVSGEYIGVSLIDTGYLSKIGLKLQTL